MSVSSSFPIQYSMLDVGCSMFIFSVPPTVQAAEHFSGILLEKSLLSPATCCLVNPDGEKTVQKAFESITLLSHRLREKYQIDDSP